jgi:hypothetical protein
LLNLSLGLSQLIQHSGDAESDVKRITESLLEEKDYPWDLREHLEELVDTVRPAGVTVFYDKAGLTASVGYTTDE